MPRNAVRMPNCTYGAACTRKGCAYVHPKKHVVNEDVICVPFLSGNCLFGKKCRNFHIENSSERGKLLQKYGMKPCRFGANCRNFDCLFYHPERVSEEETTEADSETNEKIAHQEMQRKLYEEKLKELIKEQQQQQQQHSPPITGKSENIDEDDENVNTNHSVDYDENMENDNGDDMDDLARRMCESCIDGTPVIQNMQEFPTLGTDKNNSKKNASQPLTMAQRVAQISTTDSFEQRHGDFAGASPSRPIIKVPQELWVDTLSRNASVFSIPDPMERFRQVNSGNRHSGIVDLHFQTSSTVCDLLDQVLRSVPFYDTVEPYREGYIWIVTGTGHHTTQRLQRLFDVVQEYLEHNEYDYKIGKDNNGHLGSFYVKINRFS